MLNFVATFMTLRQNTGRTHVGCVLTQVWLCAVVLHCCLFLCADPLELAFKPAMAFNKAGESDELKQLRFQHHEQLRQVGLCVCGRL